MNTVCVLALLVPGIARGQAPVEFRIGVHSDNTKRNTSLGDAVTGRGSASVQTFEALLFSGDGGAGIGGRVMRGTFVDDFTLKEGIVVLGAAVFQVEGAYGQRSLSGTDSLVTFGRAGARSVIQIGGSGVSLGFAGSKYFPRTFDFANSKDSTGKPDGWEGETDIYYTAPKVPFYLQLGYRTEYFQYGKREENMHGVMLGAGIWFGGR